MLVSSLHSCVCANTRTHLPFHVRHHVCAHDEKVLNTDICVCIYSCDDVAQGHFRQRKGIAGQVLQQAKCSNTTIVIVVKTDFWLVSTLFPQNKQYFVLSYGSLEIRTLLLRDGVATHFVLLWL